MRHSFRVRYGDDERKTAFDSAVLEKYVPQYAETAVSQKITAWMGGPLVAPPGGSQSSSVASELVPRYTHFSGTCDVTGQILYVHGTEMNYWTRVLVTNDRDRHQFIVRQNV